MNLRRAHRSLIGAAVLTTVPLIAASAAWACQTVTTLQVNPQQGAAGSQVTVTGSNYATPSASNPSPSPVYIHLDSRDAPPIGQAPAARTISVNVTIPADAAIGYHTLIATQNNTDGTPKSGTPGRASFQVVGAAAASNSSAIAPSSSADQQPTSGSTATSPKASSSPKISSSSTKASASSAKVAQTTAARSASASSPAPAAATISPAAPVEAPQPASTIGTDAAPVVGQPALVSASSTSARPSSVGRFIIVGALMLAALSLMAGATSGRLAFGARRRLAVV